MPARPLQIRFALGERPYRFWVSDPVAGAEGPARYKVLSKRRADGALEVIVVEERGTAGRHTLLERELDAATPAGGLERWVEDLGEALPARFHAFDLRAIETEAEWIAMADRLGWLQTRRPSGEGP